MASAAAADHSDWRPPDALIASGVGMLALSVVMLRLMMADDDESFLVAAMAQGGIYALSVWLVLRRPPGRGALAAILGVAVIARLIALPSPPTLSTDAYRYVWDGHVQAAGFNPYRYVPADPQLGSLRDDAIYPNVDRSEYAIAIYPPVAEMIFLVVSRASETLTAIKAAMLVFDLITIAAIIAWLKRDRLPPERVIIYAWHPLPIWEFAGTGHIDAAAIALMSVSILAASGGWRGTAGAMFALASLVKPFPLVIGPALWRRWDWRMPAAFIAAVVAAYVPYLGAGWQVLGFLHGYADEELYLNGKGFVVVAALRALGLPSPSGAVFAVFALAVLAAIAAGVIFRARSSEVEPAAALLLGAAFLVLTSPHYAWYFAWVLPLLCRTVYAPLLYLSLASFLLYFVEVQDVDENLTPWWWLYLGFAALAAADFTMRRKLSRIRELVLGRSRAPLELPTATQPAPLTMRRR
jgi:alpha-1,6-mannosyltransferase